MLLENSSPEKFVCLEGTIAHYSEQVEQGLFILSINDDSQISAVAMVAMERGAIPAGNYSQRNYKEPAYYVKFMLGSKVCKGWVWVSLFKNGDVVKVAGERNAEGYYELYSIYRPDDGVIALYPHCLRGRKAHNRASVKYYFIALLVCSVFYFLFSIYVTSADFEDMLFITAETTAITAPILALIGYSLFMKWRVFIKLSEKIFKTFGFNDVENIDLPKSTKQSIKEGEIGSAAIGLYIFRYQQDIRSDDTALSRK